MFTGEESEKKTHREREGNRHRRHLQLAINKRSARRRSRLFAAGAGRGSRMPSIICDANKSPKNHGAEKQK